jgi:hypothetical protein
MKWEMSQQVDQPQVFQWPQGNYSAYDLYPNWLYRQQAEQQLRKQQRDQQLYRMNMFNSLNDINSNLEQIRRQQSSENFSRQLESMNQFKK